MSKKYRSAASSSSSKSLAYDFALLGLREQESRTEIIRQAATQTANRLHDALDDHEDREEVLAELAVCTYRLLDPRRRRKPLERIQLSVFSEVDLDLQVASRQPLLQPASLHESSTAKVLRRPTAISKSPRVDAEDPRQLG